VIHPQAGDRLEHVQAPLPGPERVRHRGDGAELEPAGAEPDPVRRDPVELHHQDPDQLGAGRRLHTQQPLDGEAVDRLVEDRREVVRPRQERDGLGPIPVLDVLLDAGVQIPDDRPAIGDGLAAQFEGQAQHSVGRRMLRAEVQIQPFLVDRIAAEHLVPISAVQGVHGAIGRLSRLSVGHANCSCSSN
jgi:hypothetical protein